MSLASAGKKVIIIGADLRKPKLVEELGLEKGKRGLSDYLINSIELDEAIEQVPNVENLHVIPSGAIPPNPAELLASKRMSQLFEELTTKYDYLIVDGAPIGLVSDFLVYSNYLDASIYIMRQGYTKRIVLSQLKERIETKKMDNTYVVFNDVTTDYTYGNYGYGGYNYGYGYGYYDEKPRGLFSRIKNMISKDK